MKRLTSFFTFFLALFALFVINADAQEYTPKKGDIKVTIIYANGEDTNFDMDYYTEKHMPMVADLFGEYLLGYGIEEGIGGRTPDAPAPYLAMGFFYFKTVKDFGEAMGPNALKIREDIPNYTNVEPEVLVSKVIK